MDHREKKELVRRFITPDLDDITEKLVLMEPYLGADRNNIFPPNAAFVEKELYKDPELHLEVSKLKFKFMNDAQALLHGDLGTSSRYRAGESISRIILQKAPLSMRLGIMSRLERYIVLVACLLFGYPNIAMAVIAVFANITAIQRLLYMRKELDKAE